MEVGTDQQFDFLRDWQRKVYEAGYLGMAWPEAYGGGGKAQAFQNIVNAGDGSSRSALRTQHHRFELGGSADPPHGKRGGKAALHSAHPQRRGHLVSGLLRAGSRLGPGQCADSSGARRRRVRPSMAARMWTSLGKYAKYMILLGAHRSGRVEQIRRLELLPGADDGGRGRDQPDS